APASALAGTEGPELKSRVQSEHSWMRSSATADYGKGPLTVLHGPHRGLRPIADPDLAKDGFDMNLHLRLSDLDLSSDDFVRRAFSNGAQNGVLTRRQLRPLQLGKLRHPWRRFRQVSVYFWRCFQPQWISNINKQFRRQDGLSKHNEFQRFDERIAPFLAI